MNVLREHTIATNMLHVLILMVHSTVLVILATMEMETVVMVSLLFPYCSCIHILTIPFYEYCS